MQDSEHQPSDVHLLESSSKPAAALPPLTREQIKSERRAIMYGDIVANQVIAMQAALVEFYVGRGSVPAIEWIENTLEGPGHLPDYEEAQKLGGAQAWFDAKMAAHEAFRAAHPMPEVHQAAAAQTTAQPDVQGDAK